MFSSRRFDAIKIVPEDLKVLRRLIFMAFIFVMVIFFSVW